MTLSHFFNGAPQTLQLLNNSGGSLLPGSVACQLDGEGRANLVKCASTEGWFGH